MRRVLLARLRFAALAALMLAVTTSAVSAQFPLENRGEDLGLRSTAIRALHDVERTPQVILSARSRQSNPPNRSWVKRHPMLFGAIVGAVVGAGIVGTAVDAEASFVGFYGGAAAGAMVGWAVSR